MLGLPKLSRAVAPKLGLERYIGLLVMSLSPVIYGRINAYQSSLDMSIMILTQLAQTIVVLCAMVKEGVKGILANLIVSIIIMVTLLPMLLMLLTYVYDPR